MKVMKVVLAALILINITLASAAAAEVDVLVHKLVKDGMLTPNQGKIVQDDISTSCPIPNWIQKIKFDGEVCPRSSDNAEDQ